MSEPMSGITPLNRLQITRPQISSPSTMTASETEREIVRLPAADQQERNNRRFKPKYIGDCVSDDMYSPRKAKRNWVVAKGHIVKQKKAISSLQQQRRRLLKRVRNLKSLMDELKQNQNLSQNAETTIMASLPDSAKAIVERMLHGPSKQKYEPQLRSFAMTLNFYSAKAYNYIRDKFNKSLPHPSTITKWFQSVNGEPGFTEEALNALKIKVADAKSKNTTVYCNLVFDEIHIRQQEIWTGKEFKGHVNIGTKFEDHVELAIQALVFMLVAINGNWKIPVGYFLLNGLQAYEKANLINRCLEFVHQSAVEVVSLTYDGAPVNITMTSELGASISNPPSGALNTKFDHPITKKPVYIILDACHMLKLVRNCLASVGEISHDDGGVIRWRYFQALCDLQYEEGLHAGTKLRRRHIRWFEEKMRVKLAAQTFSRSVADAFTYLKDDLKLEQFKDCEETITFCLLVNDLFDIFNSRNYMCKYKYKKPLDVQTFIFMVQKMEEYKLYISKLKIDGTPVLQGRRKTGFLGFLCGIESVISIFKNLVQCEVPQLKFLLLYKFSQDHLEIFFSAIRSRGGFNNNLNAKQFEYAYKRLLVHAEIKGSDSANCTAMDNTAILNVSSQSISKTQMGENLSESEEYLQVMLETDHDYTSSRVWHLTTYQNDVVAYKAGFVVKRLIKSIY